MEKYIFGGFIACSGTMDNGTAWKNINVMLADCTKKAPVCAFVCKMPYSPDNLAALGALKFGSTVYALFDRRGRLVDITPIG